MQLGSEFWFDHWEPVVGLYARSSAARQRRCFGESVNPLWRSGIHWAGCVGAPKEKVVRRALFVGLLVAGAVSGQSGQGAGSLPVLASANASQLDEGIYASPDKALSLVLNRELCNGAQQPMRWRDASDPLRFAAQPLAQLSSGGVEYAELRPFLELRVTLAGVVLRRRFLTNSGAS